MTQGSNQVLVEDLARTGYTPALELQQRLVARVQAEGEPSYVLLVEHDPPVITLGRRAQMGHVLADPERLAAAGIELVKVTRGGDVTWHGPGQLVAYPILRLDTRGLTLRAYVGRLEQAVIDTLARLGIAAGRRDGLVGVWVGQEKVAAIGVAVSRWVTYHGLSLNVAADVGGFDAIIPCGIAGAAVTSVSRLLGRDVSVEEVKPLLVESLCKCLDFDEVREDCGLRTCLPAGRLPDCGFPQSERLTLSGPLAGIEGLGDGVCSSCNPSPSRTEESRPPITDDGSQNPKDLPRGNPQSAIRNPQSVRQRLPRWLRKAIPAEPGAAEVRRVLGRLGLGTVCSSARCPNQAECFSRKTATFMILGDRCTRRCRFCAVEGGQPLPVNHAEAPAVAEAAAALGLRHVVITSVTRDDLPDGGAGHFAKVTLAVRARLPEAVIEILIPDFQGDERALAAALAGGCDVLNHNVETVPRLYPAVRPQADYRRSLRVLEAARRIAGTRAKKLWTKSGLMLGLGETREELPAVLADLRAAGCDILTLGQYLAPSPAHHPVARFIPPEEFDEIRAQAESFGFSAVAAGPFVRSSYHAEDVFNAGLAGGGKQYQ
jgi:lipoic acid synthetase